MYKRQLLERAPERFQEVYILKGREDKRLLPLIHALEAQGVVIQLANRQFLDEKRDVYKRQGLHFKIPFIESVKMLDARIQTMDNQADRFVTKEKKDLIVDSYICLLYTSPVRRRIRRRCVCWWI